MPETEIKKYVVRLSADERETLESMIHKGKRPAAQVLKARNTSLSTVFRTRQRLVEEGFEAVLNREHSPNSARRRIFDGAAEAKLIALTCSPPPKGRARWTLGLLEKKVG